MRQKWKRLSDAAVVLLLMAVIMAVISGCSAPKGTGERENILAVLAAIWLFPIFWVILTSFRAEKGSYVSTFFPKAYTLANYKKLFTDTTILNFPRMFTNTLVIAVFSCFFPPSLCSVSPTASRGFALNIAKPT